MPRSVSVTEPARQTVGPTDFAPQATPEVELTPGCPSSPTPPSPSPLTFLTSTGEPTPSPFAFPTPVPPPPCDPAVRNLSPVLDGDFPRPTIVEIENWGTAPGICVLVTYVALQERDVDSFLVQVEFGNDTDQQIGYTDEEFFLVLADERVVGARISPTPVRYILARSTYVDHFEFPVDGESTREFVWRHPGSEEIRVKLVY